MVQVVAPLLIPTLERMFSVLVGLITIVLGALLLKSGVYRETKLSAEFATLAGAGKAWSPTAKFALEGGPGIVLAMFGAAVVWLSAATKHDITIKIPTADGQSAVVISNFEHWSGTKDWQMQLYDSLRRLNAALRAAAKKDPDTARSVAVAVRESSLTVWEKWIKTEMAVTKYYQKMVEEKNLGKAAAVLNDWAIVRHELVTYLGSESAFEPAAENGGVPRFGVGERTEFRQAFVDFTKKYPEIFQSRKDSEKE